MKFVGRGRGGRKGTIVGEEHGLISSLLLSEMGGGLLEGGEKGEGGWGRGRMWGGL